VKVDAATVPAVVITSIGLLPQHGAVIGTLILIDQRPVSSIGIVVVFQGEPLNFIPPTGMLSCGTKLEPVIVTKV
jgi:hypothetical protein